MTRARLARRELGDSLRNYWFGVNLGLFALGGLLLMLFGVPDAAVFGHRGFSRALAGLMQLALFLVPLMALFPSAVSLSGEREVGTLEYLLAQPVTRAEVFTGKWTGVSAAVLLSLAIAFGLTGAAAASRGVPAGTLAALGGLTLLLAAAFVSLGFLVSGASASRGRSTSVALTLWLALLGLGSLGLTGSLVAWGVPPIVLEVWAFVNPIEAFRMAMLTLLDPGLEVLGPVGSSLRETLGAGGLVALCLASLTGWAVGGYLAGRALFARAVP